MHSFYWALSGRKLIIMVRTLNSIKFSSHRNIVCFECSSTLSWWDWVSFSEFCPSVWYLFLNFFLLITPNIVTQIDFFTTQRALLIFNHQNSCMLIYCWADNRLTFSSDVWRVSAFIDFPFFFKGAVTWALSFFLILWVCISYLCFDSIDNGFKAPSPYTLWFLFLQLDLHCAECAVLH